MTLATVTKQSPRVESSGLTGRHVLWSLIAFFGLIFAVNGYFLYAALSTYSGVVANEPYRKGLEYNQRIAADARQHELGWTESLDIAATRDTLLLDLKDKNGLPVVGLKTVKAAVGRPSTNKHDVIVELDETAPGHYTAAIPKLADGEWVVSVNAVMPANAAIDVYRLRKRIGLKP